ncbi:peroxisomal assembly protein [Sorochytrium milnesiophthora]
MVPLQVGQQGEALEVLLDAVVVEAADQPSYDRLGDASVARSALLGHVVCCGDQLTVKAGQQQVTVSIVDTGRYLRGAVAEHTDITVVHKTGASVPRPARSISPKRPPRSPKRTSMLADWDDLWSIAATGDSWDGGLSATGSRPVAVRMKCARHADLQELDDAFATVKLTPDDFEQLGVVEGGFSLTSTGGIGATSESQNGSLISPVLCYNAFIRKAPAHEWLKVKPDPEWRATLLPTAESNPVPVAQEVVLSHVMSPLSRLGSTIDACLPKLQSYFGAAQRLVSVDDVIPIVVEESELFLLRCAAEESKPLLGEHNSALHDEVGSRRRHVVYFAVTSVTGPAGDDAERDYAVDPSVTRISHRGASHRYNSLHPVIEQSLGLDTWAHVDEQSMPLFSTVRQEMSTALYGSVMLLPTILVDGRPRSGKQTVIAMAAARLGLAICTVDCHAVACAAADNRATVAQCLAAAVHEQMACMPAVLVLSHIEALTLRSPVEEEDASLSTGIKQLFEELSAKARELGLPLVVTATTVDVEKVPANIRALFLCNHAIPAPAERERLLILQSALHKTPSSRDVDVVKLARQTASFVAGDLTALVRRAVHHALLSAQKQSQTSTTIGQLAKLGVRVTAADFDVALQEAHVAQSDAIGAPKIPTVTWDDVGGLASVKRDILDTIQLPLQHPELFASGMKKRSGILFFGPPGSGKTLLAKAVATTCSLNFLSVKGPELLNMYIGESERNVREIFQRARDAKPCVIFFDELDSVAPKRGEKGDAGGVMDRIVSQLLAELDGMNSSGGEAVFVIGATNRPDLLDEALLRPGRFDKLVYLGVAEDHDSQLKVLQALTRKFTLDADLNLMDIAAQCPFHYTGADFYALCSDALLKAMTRTVAQVEAHVDVLNEQRRDSEAPTITSSYYLEHMDEIDGQKMDTRVTVQSADFELALAELVPSVSPDEMASYKQVQARFAPPKTSAVGKQQKGKGKGKGKA